MILEAIKLLLDDTFSDRVYLFVAPMQNITYPYCLLDYTEEKLGNYSLNISRNEVSITVLSNQASAEEILGLKDTIIQTLDKVIPDADDYVYQNFVYLSSTSPTKDFQTKNWKMKMKFKIISEKN